MYRVVAIGGTFDRLHKGHRYFIKHAFSLTEKVIIGLTSDKFVKAKISNFKFSRETGSRYAGQISNKLQFQNFQTRKNELENFLEKERFLERAKIVKIDNIYGSAIENNEIEALVVTRETLAGGRLVNKRRRELGLSSLKLLQVPLVLAEDHKHIASTRIRLGEIDRWGRAFSKQLSNFQFPISNKLRYELKKPLGVLIRGDVNNHQKALPELKETIKKIQPALLITVGDEVTKLSYENGLFPNLSVFDFRVGRKKIYSSLEEISILNFRGRAKIVYNPPGYITIELVNAVERAMKNLVKAGQQQIIKVDGEEDLAGVPAILFAPLGSLITYGQPGEGIVAVEVTEAKKNQLIKYINNCIPGRESTY